ncbi:MAG TPA: histone deacetylase [Thermoanaerobaculia bacterium]|nr:histone deacetylase [Thermoanaerobaculia bacterium]
MAASLLPWLTRRLRRRPSAALVYSPRYRLELPGLTYDTGRGDKILAFLAAEGLVRRGSVQVPRPVPFQALCRVHPPAYLETLGDRDVLTRVVGLPTTERQRERILDAQRRMAGGTVLAARLAVDSGGIAANLGGGLHHAFPARGARFCLINDVAVAIAAERDRGLAGPVLVIDGDLHDGDGTRACFATDPTVHTFSMHNGSSGTDPDAVASTSVELGAGVDDAAYLAALESHLPPVVAALRPVLAVYLAGTDGAADDTLGDGELTAEGLFQRDCRVTELLRERRPAVPMVVVLAGGYGREAWRYSARYLSWLLTGRRHEPPPTEELMLQGYRRHARTFRHEELSGEPTTPDEPDWNLSSEDVLGPLAGAPAHRFLGFYTQSGVELALERTGYLERLRRLGFPQPTVELEPDHPAGETVRIWGSPEHRELLVELRARLERAAMPGFELLRVEWLMQQNPRLDFGPARPHLPGQRHPGLGVLDDTLSLLVLICDRLHLDGIYFIPSHYHLAAQSRRLLRFVEPEHEGVFRAVTRAVAGLPLPEATRLVDEGGLLDETTGRPFELPPMPMVLPVTDRLRTHLDDGDSEARAEAAAQAHRLARR